MERSSLRAAAVQRGRARSASRPQDGKVHDLAVLGISHEVGAAPAFYAGRVAGHVTPETLEDLGFDTTFDELHIKVADPTLDQDGIRAVAEEVSTRIQRAGIPVFGSYVPVARPPPRQRPAPGVLPGPRVHRRPGADRVRLPGRQHGVGHPRPADAPDRDHEGDRRPQRPDRGAVPRARARLRPARARRRAAARARSAPTASPSSPRASPTSTSSAVSIPVEVIALEVVIGLRRPPARGARPDLPRRPDHRARGARLDRASRTASATAGSTACCATSAASPAPPCSRSATRSGARAG